MNHRFLHIFRGPPHFIKYPLITGFPRSLMSLSLDPDASLEGDRGDLPNGEADIPPSSESEDVLLAWAARFLEGDATADIGDEGSVKTTVGDAGGMAREMAAVDFCDASGSALDPDSVTGTDGGMTTGVLGTLEV